MDLHNNPPDWLAPLTEGTHGCFFYTTAEKFFSIAAPFLNQAMTSLKERALWILPPAYSFQRARAELQGYLRYDLQTILEMRRLILFTWEDWYGSEISIRKMVQRQLKILKQTLKEGFDSLRILSHAPARTSHYWKDFLIYEESVSKSALRYPMTSLCGYSLIDCPAAAIPHVATHHALCLIHHGNHWEWLLNPPKSVAISKHSV